MNNTQRIWTQLLLETSFLDCKRVSFPAITELFLGPFWCSLRQAEVPLPSRDFMGLTNLELNEEN